MYIYIYIYIYSQINNVSSDGNIVNYDICMCANTYI